MKRGKCKKGEIPSCTGKQKCYGPREVPEADNVRTGDEIGCQNESPFEDGSIHP